MSADLVIASGPVEGLVGQGVGLLVVLARDVVEGDLVEAWRRSSQDAVEEGDEAGVFDAVAADVPGARSAPSPCAPRRVLAPSARAASRPAIRPRYSATLLVCDAEALGDPRRGSPSGSMTTAPWRPGRGCRARRRRSRRPRCRGVRAAQPGVMAAGRASISPSLTLTWSTSSRRSCWLSRQGERLPLRRRGGPARRCGCGGARRRRRSARRAIRRRAALLRP